MSEEHRIFMTWRIVWTKPDPVTNRAQPKNLEAAKRDAHRLRSNGNVLTGCSFDAFVQSWDECPVCHNRGTNEGGRQGPHWADPFFNEIERARQSHWQPKVKKTR